MQNIGTRGAQAFFLIVFPVFFAYQAAAAFAIIPPFLGGGLTGAAALALICLAPFVALPALRTWAWHLPVVALVAIVLAYAAYHHLYGLRYQRKFEVTLDSLKLVAAWGGLYCIGLLFRPCERFRSVIVWALVIMAVIAPFLVQTPAMSLVDTVRAGWNVASYQFFAGAFVFTAIVALALSWGRKAEPYIVALGLAGTFILISRSEQVGFLALALGWGILKAWHGQFRPVGIAALATAAFIAVGLVVASVPAPFIPDPLTGEQIEKRIGAGGIAARQAELADLGGSESWGERSKFLATGIDDIQRSPIWGDYAGQIRDHGFSGAYIHNALSAWRQYGFFAFVLYVGLCVVPPVWAGIRLLRTRDTAPEWLLAAMVGGYCAVLAIGAKAIFWPMPSLAWGLFIAAMLAERDTGREARRPLTRSLQG